MYIACRDGRSQNAWLSDEQIYEEIVRASIEY